MNSIGLYLRNHFWARALAAAVLVPLSPILAFILLLIVLGDGAVRLGR